MTESRREHVDAIVFEALEAPAEARPKVVEQACGSDRELRREVESLLLAAEGMEQDFLDTPVLPLRGERGSHPGLEIGDRVGAYRLREELGRGGMGRVFRAVRDDEEFEQEVALKVLKRGVDTDEIVRRFLHERQILARLHHPNIAGLMDGGTTAEGLPYFVMERIHGVPIHHYCDQQQLPVRARLELFLKVCSAVHFAHQNLVVHRDLKPGNILISEDGEPKLLDFGIAKLLAPDQGPQTAVDVRPMTLPYASPEQILGQPITTACDVYSLGVLLYELLTGRHPHPPDRQQGQSLAQWICYSEPETPSRVLQRPGEKEDAATVSAARATEPTALRRRLTGDLDAIVLKALAKDPQQRYASVEQLAEDLHRHLDGLPVKARPPAVFYRVGRFLRRHRLGVGITALLLAVVVTIGVLWNQAAEERRQTQALQGLVVNFFMETVTEGSEIQEKDILEFLRQAESRIPESLGQKPEVRVVVANALGYAYFQRGQNENAEPLLEESVRLGRVTPGVAREQRVFSLVNLAALRKAQGEPEATEDLLQEARKLAEAEGNPALLAIVLQNLAGLRDSRKLWPEAEALYRQALAAKAAFYGAETLQVAHVRNNLAFNLKQQKRFEEAEAEYRQSVALYDRLEKDPSIDATKARLNLGVLLMEDGRLEAAEPLLERSVEERRLLQGSLHSDTANGLHYLAILRQLQGRLDEAEVLYRDTLAIKENLNGKGAYETATVLRDLASLKLQKGEVSAARQTIARVLVIYRDHPPETWRLAAAESVQGGCLLALGRRGEAAPILEQSYQTLRAERGDKDRYTREARARVERL